ncbi:retrovirus-related Pol polyprotein from transposon opus [Trichonephila clavipes]|uniref:RNA-directed DNA polymerase n=1 Tax=Trichonephila clavipes TaxID=2585209 RepID=A0A8X6VWC0_TRICX|nr:retrovirus-related Pol polyprotein from transposon opus [Trichonephila clavipes]
MTNLDLKILNVVPSYYHHNDVGVAEYHHRQHLPHLAAHKWLTHVLVETFLPTMLLYEMNTLHMKILLNLRCAALEQMQQLKELFSIGNDFLDKHAVLNQEQRPIVYASRTLSSTEKYYTVTEREYLAVIWALNKIRTYLGSLPVKVITDHAALTRLISGKNLSSRMIMWVLKLAEFNIEWGHRFETQNAVADVLSRNLVESTVGKNVACAVIRDLVLSSREQLIEEQRRDPELGHIYRYFETPEDSSVNATICENWSRDFRLVEGLLFYAKYATALGEMRVYIAQSLRGEIMREFHDKPIASHLRRNKTYSKICDVCYFHYMRKYVNQYVFSCHVCQTVNYKNTLPAGRLVPIVTNYPNEIVTLDLLGPYPASRVRRNRYVLVITDHFSK